MPLPAMKRYDGPLYQVLRKSIREGAILPGIRVAIVSAKFGLIEADSLIPFYDQRLNARRAATLGPKVQADLTRLLARHRFGCVRINLGRDYAKLIEGMPALKNAIWASGSIGVRAATLKTWLRGTESRRGRLID